MEVELAGLLSTLERLASKAPADSEGRYLEQRRGKLEEWLQALEDGTFPLLQLLGGGHACEKKCFTMVRCLRTAMANNLLPAIADAARTLAIEIEDLISAAS